MKQIHIVGYSFLLVGLLSAPARAQTSSPVIWKGLTNVITTGASNNGLQKTGGVDSNADAGAYSQQVIASNNGYLEFTAVATTYNCYVGLTC